MIGPRPTVITKFTTRIVNICRSHKIEPIWASLPVASPQSMQLGVIIHKSMDAKPAPTNVIRNEVKDKKTAIGLKTYCTGSN